MLEPVKDNVFKSQKLKKWEIENKNLYQKFKTGEELNEHFTSKYFVEKKINPLKSINYM